MRREREKDTASPEVGRGGKETGKTAQNVCKEGEDSEKQRKRDAIKRGLDGEAAPAVARDRGFGRRMRRWCEVERDGG